MLVAAMDDENQAITLTTGPDTLNDPEVRFEEACGAEFVRALISRTPFRDKGKA